MAPSSFLRFIIRLLSTQSLRVRWGEWNINRVPKIKGKQRKVFKRIKRTQRVRICFIASSLSMWRFDSLCREFINDHRFSVIVLVHPFNNYTNDVKVGEIEKLKKHFSQQSIPFLIIKDPMEFYEYKKKNGLDIIFYPQPYGSTYSGSINWRDNLDCLFVYIPYSVGLSEFKWTCDLPFHNIAFRQYYPTKEQYKAAVPLARNKGRNIRTLGDLRVGEFLKPVRRDPWKDIKDSKTRKRIIWAPHFQMRKDVDFSRPDFEWTYQIMLDIAIKYEDKIQIAFKPHPRLKTELYNHPEWGNERTDEYYHQWATMHNTQREEGDFEDLFKTSDAMIHNSGSFTAEYLYVNKPTLYTTCDLDGICRTMHSFGLRCMDAHYIASTPEDIERFIVDVVLDGKDSLKEARSKVFVDKFNDGLTVAQRIHHDLVKSLGLK